MIGQLQTLRFFFIFLIVCSHLSIIGFPQFDAGGDCGVAFFFVLSGYLTVLRYGKALEEKKFCHKEYLINRIKKIYPLFFLSWLLAVLIKHNTNDLLCALPSLVWVQTWILKKEIYFGGNPVAWFLSVLMTAWILLPLLYRIMKNKWAIIILLPLYAIYCFNIPEEDINAWLYVFAPIRLMDFMLGMGLYMLLGQREMSSNASLILFSLGISGVVVCLYFYPDIEPHLRNAAIFWPFIIMIIPTASFLPSVCNKILLWRPLLFLGNHSLEIYLFHLVVIWLFAAIIRHYGHFI